MPLILFYLQNKSPNTSTPAVQEGSFQLSLLKRCSPLVRRCYGCKGVLKLRRGEEFFIPNPPEDLVIISSTRRAYWQNGEQKTGRLGNVYFHCKVECVQKLQPQFIPFLVIISAAVKRELLEVHRNHIQKELGL